MIRRSKKKGPKGVAYQLIERDGVVGKPMYKLLRDLIAAHHDELTYANIALAWNKSWKPDVDGRVTLGKCKKASDLDRELAAFDFVIILRQSFWQDLMVTDAQRAALLDHELCHGTVKLDERTGEPVIDERGRKVYRVRKHDIEEFGDIVSRHGVYKRDLEVFAAQLLARAEREGFAPCKACVDSPGWAIVVEGGVPRNKRCACWTAFQQRRAEALLVKKAS